MTALAQPVLIWCNCPQSEPGLAFIDPRTHVCTECMVSLGGLSVWHVSNGHRRQACPYLVQILAIVIAPVRLFPHKNT